MRMRNDLECYIDDYSLINIYMSKNFYGGKSRIFHLKDETGKIIPLNIEAKEEYENALRYSCSPDGEIEVGRQYILFDEHCQQTPAQYSHIVKTPKFSEDFLTDDSKLGVFYTPEKTTFRVWSPVAGNISVRLLDPDAITQKPQSHELHAIGETIGEGESAMAKALSKEGSEAKASAAEHTEPEKKTESENAPSQNENPQADLGEVSLQEAEHAEKAEEEEMTVVKTDQSVIYPMQRLNKGVWQLEVDGDLLRRPYVYRIEVNGTIQETCDPYSPFTGVNTMYSVVDSIDRLSLPEKVAVEPMESQNDAIIYEASIRDMTSQSGIGVLHPSTFEGFTEESPITRMKNTGFSYLKNLGVTHVQLMPVFDFGSVDEEYPNIFYNWGYDPMHYRAMEGSYTSNPWDAAGRIEEFANLVQELHKAGLKVNVDLVFNHVWNKDRFALERLVPSYYFLMDSYGNFSNGSFCGNDIDTRVEMSRRYFLDTCRYMIEVLDVDGFRFDLMGILDYSLLNEIAEMARSIKPDFMIYGEGWDMPSYLDPKLRASQNNQALMPVVGHFSDRFREVIRGSNGDLPQQGFSNGNTGLIEDARQVMSASVLENRYDSPAKAINYVECHDNHTLWDKNRAACSNESHQVRQKRQILANAMVLLAQGIPFLHAGQEFGRTKQNLGNTYNRSDSYNRIDYQRRDANQVIVDATKKLIEIRRSHPSLRLASKEEITANTSTETIAGQVLVMRTQKDGDRLMNFFNPTQSYFEYILHEDGTVLFDSGSANGPKTSRVVIAPVSAVSVQLDPR